MIKKCLQRTHAWFQQQEFKRVVERLKGKAVDSFSQDVTHIVTTVGKLIIDRSRKERFLFLIQDLGKDGKKLARRTLKYLQGIVCGKWILDASCKPVAW
jgi:hypothetical protein